MMMKKLFTIILSITILSCSCLSQTATWNGSTDNDWHKECNWTPNTIPTVSHTVVIPTATPYPTVAANAHCDVLNITTTDANAVNITGSGILCISSTNGGACPGTPTNNGGCSVPGSSFSHNGDTYTFGVFDCVDIPADGQFFFAMGSRMITNNTSFNITLVIPNFGCAEQNPAPGSFLLTPGSSVNLFVQAGVTTSVPGCCVGNLTRTVTWSSTDGASGSFDIETINNL